MASDGPLREYLDHRVFLGLNAASEPVRRRCKALVATRLKAQAVLFMTFDQVGRCDDAIWRFNRRLQDAYYPFMDALHCHRCLQREGYGDATLRLAGDETRLAALPAEDRLSLARALEQQGVVYTLAAGLLAHPELPVRAPPPVEVDIAFPDWLESLYRQSLQLRIDDGSPEVSPCTAA